MRKKATFKGYPVKVKGVVYQSTTEAAKAFGLTSSAIQNAIERGTTDFVGTGTGSAKATIVEHNGIRYKTSGYFARRFGLDPKEITKKLSNSIKRKRREFETEVGEVKIIGRLKDLGWSEENESK